MNAARGKLHRRQRENVARNNFRRAWCRDIASKRVNWNEVGRRRATAFRRSARCQLARQARYFRLVRISDHACDARNCSQFGRSALRIAARDDDARPGIGGVNFPHGFPRLRIRRRRNRAGVQHDDAGGRRGPAASVNPEFSSSWRIAAASASVARQPKFSMENVAMMFEPDGAARGNYNSDSVFSTKPGSERTDYSCGCGSATCCGAGNRGGSSPRGDGRRTWRASSTREISRCARKYAGAPPLPCWRDSRAGC